MVTEQKLKQLIDATGLNFQFKLGKEFKPIFDTLYQKIKSQDEKKIEKKFQELWKMTAKEWNDEFGFRGYPSLSSWLEILVEKPLTEAEIEKKRIEHKQMLQLQAGTVINWLHAPEGIRLFCQRYKNEDYKQIKQVLDKFCNVRQELGVERIVDMAEFLLKKINEDKQDFCLKFIKIADQQQPFLLTLN